MEVLNLKTTNWNHLLHCKMRLWDSLAILYTLGSYGIGIRLILSSSAWLNAFGVTLLTHSLVLSAYIAHEFMHGNIFSSIRWNAIGGNIMLWLNGSCYIRFQELLQMHIAHHVNRIDYCRFDISSFLQSIPALLRSLFLGLEWLYVPSLAFLLRIRLIIAPFQNPDRQQDRLRVILIILIRGCLFTALTVLSLKALVLYFLAYVSMIHILRFMDAFQHTYESLPMGTSIPEQHRNASPQQAQFYEQSNTFSNIISERYHWVNLLLLNFGYHNAHHQVMRCPWYYLPTLDRILYSSHHPNHGRHYITLFELLSNYHRFRTSRILTGPGEVTDQNGSRQLETFYGAIEVSFLVVPL